MEDVKGLNELSRSRGVILSKFDLSANTFVYVLMIDRPQVRNALDFEAMSALRTYVEQIKDSLSSSCLAVVLSGKSGVFISGGDLKALKDQRSAKVAQDMSSLMRSTLSELRRLPCLFISAADGAIVGGGAEVFIAGDYRIMSLDAHLRFAQVSLALCTGWGGARRLAQIVGQSKGLALLLEGIKLSSESCLDLNLCHRVSMSPSALVDALQWLQGFCETPQALMGVKSLLKDESAPEIDEREQLIFPNLWKGDEHWQAVSRVWEQKNKPKKKKEQSMQRSQLQTDSNQQTLTSHKRGLFIVLEGIDGAGTTSQAQNLVEWLTTNGHPAHITQEPSTGVIGQLTRQALRGELIGHGKRLLPAESIALLFAADRADHWYNEIEPRLERGEVVVCDRYLYSSLAYQGLELPESWVHSLNMLYPQPDLLLFIEVAPQVAAKRRSQRGLEADRYEVDELQIQIAERYSKICKEYSACFIDGEQTLTEVTNACLAPLQNLLEMT